MLVFRIARRNIWRQRRRSILTALTMFGGFALASISIAWADGSYNFIIEMFTRNQLGHIQLHYPGYLDRPALYKTVDDYLTIGAQIEQVAGVEAWTPRLFAAGLTAVGDKTAGARIVGVDPVRENAATRFNKKVFVGRTFSVEPQHEALLGKGLAKTLRAGVDDTLIIVSQGADGSIANDMYHIIGLIESGDELSDRASLYLHLVDAQELLVLDGRVHEIAVVVDELSHVAALTASIGDAVGNADVAVASWQEFAKSFYQAMVADKRGNWILLGIIIFIVAVGVLNTVLMTVLERRREYGLLRAIGTQPGQITRLVLWETMIMAVLSIVLGAAISLVVNYALSIGGITMPQPFTYGGVEFTTMYTEINARSFYIPAIAVFTASLLVAVFPALKAARTQPARTMRMH